jgi:hypothetical protein
MPAVFKFVFWLEQPVSIIYFNSKFTVVLIVNKTPRPEKISMSQSIVLCSLDLGITWK